MGNQETIENFTADDSTVGIDVVPLHGEINKESTSIPVRLIFWDVAGQRAYLPFHQLLYTKTMVLSVFRLDIHPKGKEKDEVETGEQISRWLREIHEKAPSDTSFAESAHTYLNNDEDPKTNIQQAMPLILVATHKDVVLGSGEMNMDNILFNLHRAKKKYSKWRAFNLKECNIALNAKEPENKDVEKLVEAMFDSIEPSEVPNILIALSNKLEELKNKGKHFIEWEELKRVAEGLEGETEKLMKHLKGAMWILESWGEILVLQNIVVLNIQWLGKLIACVIDHRRKPFKRIIGESRGLLKQKDVKRLLWDSKHKYFDSLPPEEKTGMKREAFYIHVLTTFQLAVAFGESTKGTATKTVEDTTKVPTEVLIPLSLPLDEDIPSELHKFWPTDGKKKVTIPKILMGVQLYFFSKIFKKSQEGTSDGKETKYSSIDEGESESGVPIALFPRIMVCLLQQYKASPLYWRHGLLLIIGECHCLLREDRKKGMISIAIRGNESQNVSRQLLNLWNTIELETRKLFPEDGVKWRIFVRCNCRHCFQLDTIQQEWALHNSDQPNIGKSISLEQTYLHSQKVQHVDAHTKAFPISNLGVPQEIITRELTLQDYIITSKKFQKGSHNDGDDFSGIFLFYNCNTHYFHNIIENLKKFLKQQCPLLFSLRVVLKNG